MLLVHVSMPFYGVVIAVVYKVQTQHTKNRSMIKHTHTTSWDSENYRQNKNVIQLTQDGQVIHKITKGDIIQQHIDTQSV